MFYWIIPYLVAYNASETGIWRNGPIHHFKADVKSYFTMQDGRSLDTYLTMLFSCRPIDSNSIQCSVENTTIDNYEKESNHPNSMVLDKNSEVYDEICSILFEIQFDKKGIAQISFPKDYGYYIENMIRSIVDNLNIGIDLSDKKFGRYVFPDKSINGYCETIFHVKTIPRRNHEVSIDGNSFLSKLRIPSSTIELSDTETVVIEKERRMNNCAVKTPYIFGQTEAPGDSKRVKIDADVTSSRSQIDLGVNRFNSHTENRGSIITKTKSPSLTNGPKILAVKTNESIRVSLIAITPANDSFNCWTNKQSTVV